MARDNGNIFDSFIMTARKIIWSYNNTIGEGNSLQDVAKLSQVKPLTLVSEQLKGLPEIYDILHGGLNVYAMDHMLAANIMGLHLQDSRIPKILDSLNPDRDIDTLMTSVAMTSTSASVTVLSMAMAKSSEYERIETINRHVSFKGLQYGRDTPKAKEAARPAGDLTMMSNLYDLPDHMDPDFEHNNTDPIGSRGVTRVDAFEKGEAVVGKSYQLNFTVGEKGTPVSVPIVAQLNTAYVPGAVIQNLVTMNEKSIELGARFIDALKLEINPISDFIFNQDILKNDRKAMMMDPTGVTGDLIRSKNKKKLLGLLSGNVSLNTISAIMVMTEQDEDHIRRTIGGDLTNKLTRKKVFDNSSVSMIMVVDRRTNMVTTFVRNKNDYSELPFSRYKNAGLNNANAMTDLFKTLQSGRVPTF